MFKTYFPLLATSSSSFATASAKNRLFVVKEKHELNLFIWWFASGYSSAGLNDGCFEMTLMLTLLRVSMMRKNPEHMKFDCLAVLAPSCERAWVVGPTSCLQTLNLWTWSDACRRISIVPVNMDGCFSSADSVFLAGLLCGRIPHTHTSVRTKKRTSEWVQVYEILIFAYKQKRLNEPVTMIMNHTYLCATLFVCILMLNTVHFQAVWFEWATLCERFLAEIAFVWPNAGVCAGVSLQIECIVESFAAERAQIAFDIRMTFHVAVEQSLQLEWFWALSTLEFAIFRWTISRWILAAGRLFVIIGTNAMALNGINSQRILETMTTIHKLQLYFWRQSQLLKREEKKSRND